MRRTSRHFSEMLQLTPFLERAVRQLSLGQRMRAEMVMALLHEPKILFLDEPTIGLDVIAKDTVRRFLRGINQERAVTLILTTHDLQDIEQICPRLIMVDEGKLLYDGELRRLRSTLGSRRRLKLEFTEDPGSVTLQSAVLTADEGLVKHYLIEHDGVSLVDILGEIGSGRAIKDVSIEEPSIEEVIRTFYAGRMAAPAPAG